MVEIHVGHQQALAPALGRLHADIDGPALEGGGDAGAQEDKVAPLDEDVGRAVAQHLRARDRPPRPGHRLQPLGQGLLETVIVAGDEGKGEAHGR